MTSNGLKSNHNLTRARDINRQPCIRISVSSGMGQRSGVAAAAADADPADQAGDAPRLVAANINPATGLATDYLNHFNEAIMLLEMLPSAAEFRDDFLRWQPVSYREHFAGSGFEIRDAAIAAYDRADPRLRAELEALTDAMTVMLEAARSALRADLPPAHVDALARRTVAALRPLVVLAGALINGETRHGQTPAAQAAVDDLMRS